jgi:hypothetical protein
MSPDAELGRWSVDKLRELVRGGASEEEQPAPAPIA